MSKKLLSVLMIFSLLVSLIPMNIYAVVNETAYAAYGTPVIDGEIDEVWNSTNSYIVKHCSTTGEDMYKGWFKVLWDEDYLYVLAKVNSTQLKAEGYDWLHDSFDVYIDEDRARTDGYKEDDYQVRINFNALVSGNNYPDFSKVRGGAKKFDGGFVGEMAIPLVTKETKEGLTLGFEILMTASQTVANEKRIYQWNTKKDWKWDNTGCFGDLKLVKKSEISLFSEPKWAEPSPSLMFNEVEKEVILNYIPSVTVTFDKAVNNFSVLESNDYPLMYIKDLAKAIGGTSEGNTLTKGDVSITYTADSRLAEDKGGHLMLERKPVVYNGKLYVPVSSIVPTMIYTMHYNKFDKILEIKTGTDYPEPEFIVYAKDYGALGDGIHEDGKAIKRAINTAINSGKPSKVVLEPNKTYILGSNQESYAFFKLEGVENFTLDGQNSVLMFERCTNNFMEINNCTNVNILNLDVEYKEPTFSQGRITHLENKKFRLLIDEGFPLLPADDWLKNYYVDASHGGWWFTQIMDPVEPRFKYTDHYDIFLDTVVPVGEREYEITIKSGYETRLAQAKVGDRFVINTRLGNYDLGDKNMLGLVHGHLWIYKSGDITIKNVNLYGSPWHPVNIGSCWGRIKFYNFGIVTKDGRLLAGNSDGMHCYNNREGLVLDGCKLMNTLDDQINTNANSIIVNSYDGEYTYALGRETQLRTGDEMLFVQLSTHRVLGNAFVKSFSGTGNTRTIVLDRKIEGVTATNISDVVVFNLNESTRGSVVKNTTFMYSRRYGWLTKNPNSMFDNNYVFENGGSAISASDEKRPKAIEGPYPSSFTMRNNTIISPDIMPPDYPAQIQNMSIVAGETASVDGFLIENNTIDSGRSNVAFCINAVNGLYMLDNKFISNKELKSQDATPILITNSKIEAIDGIDFNFKQNVESVVTIVGCEVDEADIKNITVNDGNTATPYTIR